MSHFTHPQNANIVITPLSNLLKNGRIPSREHLPRPIIFLSGTTNYKKDETRWQQALIDSLSVPSSSTGTSDSHIKTLLPPISPAPLTIIDPYNPTWDSTWSEDPSDSKFVAQVNFELHGLEIADIVVVGFLGTEAREGIRGVGATSLVELGLGLGRMRDAVRVCVGVEGGFWKEGYVRVLCGRFGVGVMGSLEELVACLRGVVGEVCGRGRG